MIATRHNLHAPLVLGALEAHRHVFVEKPLCLTRAELAQIEAALANSRGSVQVGFNRRFAPAAIELRNLLRAAPGPKTASFRVMAGALEPTSWFANHAESGGRVLGEACHFFDFFCFLFESRPVRISAQTVWPAAGRLPFPDSVTAQVEFADGSCPVGLYSAEGDPSWPKKPAPCLGQGSLRSCRTSRPCSFTGGASARPRPSTARGMPRNGGLDRLPAGGKPAPGAVRGDTALHVADFRGCGSHPTGPHGRRRGLMSAARPGLLFIVNSLEIGGAEKQVVTLLNHLDGGRSACISPI